MLKQQDVQQKSDVFREVLIIFIAKIWGKSEVNIQYNISEGHCKNRGKKAHSNQLGRLPVGHRILVQDILYLILLPKPHSGASFYKCLEGATGPFSHIHAYDINV